MKKLKILAAAAVFTIFITRTAYAAEPNISPGCAYIVIDAKTGLVVAEKDADSKLRPASTTKIMTAIIALENGELNQEMKVSKEAVYDIGPGGMNIGIMPSETGLTLENLLNVMLVKSANETANIIAENIAPTRAGFIEMMNKKAVDLGAKNTNFVNACGKDDLKAEENHLTTPRDLANIARYAMTIPKFREIVSQETYKGLPATNKHNQWPVMTTSNKLLWDNRQYPYKVSGTEKKYTVEGIKTGYTSGAGHNLVAAAVNEEGMELISVVMHVTEGDANSVFSITKELFKYGYEQYSNQSILKTNEVAASVNVEDAKGDGKLDLLAAGEIKAVLPIDNGNKNLQVVKNINENIKAPVKQGDILGYIEYKKDGASLGKVNLLASADIEQNIKEAVKEKSKNVFHNIISNIFVRIAAIVLVLLLIRKHIRRIVRRKRKKNYINKRFR